METKKISFGFKKIQKPSDSLVAPPKLSQDQEERKDYIDCLEENSIKVVGGEVIEKKEPLVIPMKPNTLQADRFQQIAAEVEASLEEPAETVPEEKQIPVGENETLEQQAARELLEDARKIKREEPQVLSVKLPTDAPLTGQKESTLEDYEAVPISDYGMAMLRGMGWTSGQASKYTQPVLRPKGLGLGADKLVKQKDDKKGKNDANEEELSLVKGCFVRILAGKYSGSYGKVVSLNDESARATVELALGRERVEIGEQLLQPVTRDTYNERSKIINSDKYEEYKRKEQMGNEKSHSSTSKKFSQSNNSAKDYRVADKDNRHNRKDRRDSISSDEACKKSRKQYDSDSDYETQRRGDSRQNHRRDKSSNGEKYRNDNHRHSSSSETERRERKSRKKTSNRNRRSISISIEREDTINKRDRIRESSKKRKESYKKEHMEKHYSSEDEIKRKHQSKEKHKSRQSSSESADSSDEDQRRKKSKNRSETPVGKRDIDKKRKGKKKKRDRDRSPNYRKHKR